MTGALSAVRRSLRKHGATATLKRLAAAALRAMVPAREPVHPFDAEHGTDTGGLLGVRRIAAGHAHDVHTTAYYGTHPTLFRGLMAQWQGALGGSDPALEAFSFYDIGCGKGRVLMLASEYPFQAVRGVELSPSLVETARANLELWQRRPHACADINVLQADVLSLELPDTPVLLYLFHPFDEAMMRRWAAWLTAAGRSRTEPVYLAYVNPECEAVLEALPRLEPLWSGTLPYSAAEAQVDVFGYHDFRCSLYRLPPGE